MPRKSCHSDDVGPWTRRVLPTELDRIRDAEEELLVRLGQEGYGEDDCFAVRLSVEEALVNAMKHGNKMDPSKRVHMAYRASPGQVEVHVADEGDGFDPSQVPDPTADENLSKPSGRGIMLMRCYMDEVTYVREGREVHMVKYGRA